jgi:hypothetical protein
MSIKCDNLDELTKFKYNSNSSTPALSQGMKFKQFQNKYNKNSDNYIVEGFEGTKEVISTDDPTVINNPGVNPLTTQTEQIIVSNQNTIDEQQAVYDKLKTDNDTYLKQYQALMDRINKKTENYIKRTTGNPYLGKTIKFTTGQVCYVTNEGVVKYIPSEAILNSLIGNNCGVTKTYTNVNIKYPDVNTPGTLIPELSLIFGPPMKLGQSCGNSGKNVYVNKLLDNPQEKYIGCYNDKKPTKDILIVPKMNNTNIVYINDVGKFTSLASSKYRNNNNSYGPWAAFDDKDDSYWHSADSTNTNYNRQSGIYTGKTETPKIKTKNGGTETIKGEYLQIDLPQNYTLTKYELKGRQNCCGLNARSPNNWTLVGWGSNSWNEVDRRENQAPSSPTLGTYYITDPKPYNTYRIIITNCGNPGDRTGNRFTVQIARWNLFTTSDFTDSNRAMIFKPNLVDRVNFDSCKTYAARNGYKYFGLQDVKPDGNAKCLVSNSLASTQQYGKANNINMIPLWQTNTRGKSVSMSLTKEGRITIRGIKNGSMFSSILWSSPNVPQSCLKGGYVNPDSIQGSYGANCVGKPKGIDCGRPQKTSYGPAGIIGNLNSQLKKVAKKYSLYDTPTSTFSYSPLSEFKGDPAYCCSKMVDYSYQCGGGPFKKGTVSPGANIVFDCNKEVAACTVSLNVQDDGNLCIYQNGVTNAIWCSKTNGKQRKPYSEWVASKGKNKVPYLTSDQTLRPGEWIGSNNGSTMLKLEQNGNLVLYTSESLVTCTPNASGKQMGGSWINAVYEFANSGFKENIGKLGFVDENDVLYEYPSANVKFTNTYTKFDKYDTYGADLPSAAYGSATIERCQTTCNNNQNCYGFAFDNQNKVCYPKSSGMWNYGGPTRPLSYIDTYVKNKIPKSVPLGAKSDTNNIDSAQYQFYNKGTPLPQKYGLILATQSEKDELDLLEVKMKALSVEMTKLLNTYNTKTYESQSQSSKNLNSLTGYQTEMEKTIEQINILNSKSETIESFTNYGYSADNNLNKILQDSDIGVLQKNYEYLLWSILATGSVLVAMNVT